MITPFTEGLLISTVLCFLYYNSVQVLRQKLHRVFSNVRVVSNRMVFDGNGDLTGFKGKFSIYPAFIHILVLLY